MNTNGIKSSMDQQLRIVNELKELFTAYEGLDDKSGICMEDVSFLEHHVADTERAANTAKTIAARIEAAKPKKEPDKEPVVKSPKAKKTRQKVADDPKADQEPKQNQDDEFDFLN